MNWTGTYNTRGWVCVREAVVDGGITIGRREDQLEALVGLPHRIGRSLSPSDFHIATGGATDGVVVQCEENIHDFDYT